MKLDAMKRQGMRTDLTSRPVGEKLYSVEVLSKDVNDSARQSRESGRGRRYLYPGYKSRKRHSTFSAFHIRYKLCSHTDYLSPFLLGIICSLPCFAATVCMDLLLRQMKRFHYQVCDFLYQFPFLWGKPFHPCVDG